NAEQSSGFFLRILQEIELHDLALSTGQPLDASRERRVQIRLGRRPLNVVDVLKPHEALSTSNEIDRLVGGNDCSPSPEMRLVVESALAAPNLQKPFQTRILCHVLGCRMVNQSA